MLPIRYINLDRDVQRRECMEAEFSRLALEGERFPAVLWTALSAPEQAAMYSEALNASQFHKPLVNGEKGCYASHLGLWRWLLDSPHAALIVLEDDVRLRNDFGAVAEAISAREHNWDMVKLIGRNGLGKSEKLSARKPLCEGYSLVTYRRIPSLTAGYAISREGARKLLDKRKPFGRPIDVDLRHWWECDSLKVLGLDPAAIELDETSLESSIGAKIEEASLRNKWRKFQHKLNYSVKNTWYRK
jgi:glycosyl transferase family 25